MLVIVAVDTEGEINAPVAVPRLVLCAVDEPLANAWGAVADGRPGVEVHRGSVLDIPAEAVVSPANSSGWMRGGIDAVYARAFPLVEANVRSAVLALHGGELPVGEAVLVPTGEIEPQWLVSAPTMRRPAETLPDDTVHPYLAARAVLRLWRDGRLEDGRPIRSVIRTLVMPGLGTGIGGVAPGTCARQVAAAWDEVFSPLPRR
ncbi:macro domain-containing protein [Saccharothrix violaceirubra]|uniref:macro domain-containing protein n=1 Tax=Saccharothrix violaceirubra TaxID=413306 RepID=UPI00161E5F66|nr:macro domain-containing protein [Saccharothrix violaceirubra]